MSIELSNQTFESWGACPIEKEEAILRLEKAGRICWRSEEKIGEGTAKPFIQKIINHGHTAVLEKANLVVRGDSNLLRSVFFGKPYFKLSGMYVGGNLRAWLEFTKSKTVDEIYERAQAFGEICTAPPTELHRYTAKFTTSRKLTHELVRHRVMSFLQESTRYVAYRKSLKCIRPSWIKEGSKEESAYELDCQVAYDSYLGWMKRGATAQQARDFLPHSTAAEILVTGSMAEWRGLLKLRTGAGADPEMKLLMAPLAKAWL